MVSSKLSAALSFRRETSVSSAASPSSSTHPSPTHFVIPRMFPWGLLCARFQRGSSGWDRFCLASPTPLVSGTAGALLMEGRGAVGFIVDGQPCRFTWVSSLLGTSMKAEPWNWQLNMPLEGVNVKVFLLWRPPFFPTRVGQLYPPGDLAQRPLAFPPSTRFHLHFYA